MQLITQTGISVGTNSTASAATAIPLSAGSLPTIRVRVANDGNGGYIKFGGASVTCTADDIFIPPYSDHEFFVRGLGGYFSVLGGSVGATATAVLTATTLGTVTISAAGTGYTTKPTATLSGGGGTGGAINLHMKALTAVISSPGSGYDDGTVVFTMTGGTGTKPQLSCTVAGGLVTSVDSISVAGDLTVLPTNPAGFTGATGTGASFVLTYGVLSATATAGSGYTTVPTFVISGGAGTGAAGTVALTGTTVASLTLDSGGTGYLTAPTVTISGGGGSSAACASPTIYNAGPTGVVATIPLSNAGSGYTSVPTVAFSGGVTTSSGRMNVCPIENGR